MSDGQQLVTFIGGIILVFAVVLGLTLSGVYLGERASCRQLSEQTGHQTRYHFIGGCFVRLPDVGWVPRSAWRGVDGGAR